MSDLFQSLTKPDRKPGSPDAEKAKDITVVLVRELASAGSTGLTVPEITQRVSFGPTEVIGAIQEAIKVGLIAENNEDPERKRFRLTGAGQDLLRA
jgi:hypothetical protein